MKYFNFKRNKFSTMFKNMYVKTHKYLKIFKLISFKGIFNKLNNLYIVIDNNKLQTYGPPSEVAGLSNLKKKLISFGIDTVSVNGHSTSQLYKSFKKKNLKNKPRAIICNTIKLICICNLIKIYNND